MEYLEEGFRKLQVQPGIDTGNVFGQASGPSCKSKLKKFLTKEVFEALRTRKTPTFGSTLRDVIQSGVENLDSGELVGHAVSSRNWTVCAGRRGLQGVRRTV